MKPIFDKNDVQIEFAYEINHTEREAPNWRVRGVDMFNPEEKRRLRQLQSHDPDGVAKTDLANLPTAKDSYRKMAEVFFDEGKTREFRKSRGNFGWQIFVRNVFVTMLLATMVMVPTVFGLRAYVGEKDWKKVEAKFDAVIGPAFHRIDTRPKVASSAVPNPAPKAKPSKKSKRGSHK